MPFGKHRGVPLSDIETSYLQWAVTADKMTGELRDAIAAEIAGRKTAAPKTPDRPRVPSAISEGVQSLAELIVRAGYASLEDSGYPLTNDLAAAYVWLLNHIALTEVDDGDFRPF